MRKLFILSAIAVAASVSLQAQSTRTLHIVSTGDVHSAWFDQAYVPGGPVKTSLMSVSHYVDSLRKSVGRDNVLLLDAGDCLQGDNAAYYFNFVATDRPHIFPRIASYMKYDAVVVGNHDIETGHAVYDRVFAELAAKGIPWLGANVIRTADGKPYFPSCAVFDRAGVKVLVIGFENPNIRAWLSESQFEGMDFLSLVPYVQICVDAANKAYNPDVTVVVAHSGIGEGDGSSYESQALDVFQSLSGADVFICGHDHARKVIGREGRVLLDTGNRAGYVGHTTVSLSDDGSKKVDARIERLDKNNVDIRMRRRFARDFALVRDFTLEEVGEFTMTMHTRDAFAGMCDYVNLLHSVQLSSTRARISFAAPLKYDAKVKGGKILYDDMFTIYPFENQLSVVNLKGSEIKAYLEYSYDQWIETAGDHLLKLKKNPDNGKWSFAGRTYNFDSAAGLVYTVDVTKEYGQRINITVLADGSAFNPDEMYPVAMTSYRANGGGGLMLNGAGLTKEQTEERTIDRCGDIRGMVYEYIKEKGTVTPETVGDRKLIGEWRFVPEKAAADKIAADLKLVF